MWIWRLLVGALLGGALLLMSSAPAAARESAAALEVEAERLLARFAPVFVQHLGDGRRPEADRPIRIDFDGDWDMTNNWDNLARFGRDAPAAAYGSAILTETHAYLTYTLFYPRDWAEPLCLPYLCHDNDLESVRIIVERETPEGARLALVQAKAHLRYRDLAGDESARTADGRPILRVQSGGHGIGACRPGDARCQPARRRVVFAPPGADLPAGARAAASERYELLRLRDTLWARRGADPAIWGARLAYEGERHGRLGMPIGARTANGRYRGGVNPPWSLKGPAGARGDWFLDPARVALARLPGLDQGDRARALAYVFHPYLDDLRGECAGDDCPARIDVPTPSRSPAWASALFAALLALGLLRFRIPADAPGRSTSGR